MKRKPSRNNNSSRAPKTGLQGRRRRKRRPAPRKLTAPFPFVDCASPKLFQDSEETWSALLRDLDSARDRILLENYILRESAPGEAVIDQLASAAEKGVRVRVHIDGLGSIPVGGRTKRRLDEAGITLKIFNDPAEITSALVKGIRRFINRTHRRIIVIDDRIAWVGGIGISDRWWHTHSRPAARDTMLRFTGPLVDQAAAAFDHLWEKPSRAMPSARIAHALPGQARVVTQHPIRALRFRSVLYARMREAKSQIWLATPYFIPSHRLRRVLRHAAKRGIDVRLLLPGPAHHDHPSVRMAGRRHYASLLEAGVRISEYQPAFFHSKISLFDDQWVVVGSANLDRLSFFTNHELVVEARDEELAATAHRQFEEDFESSFEILLENWLERPFFDRLLERLSGLFERFL